MMGQAAPGSSPFPSRCQVFSCDQAAVYQPPKSGNQYRLESGGNVVSDYPTQRLNAIPIA